MKVAVNKCYGGFNVSKEVALKLKAKGHYIVMDGEYYKDGSGPCSSIFGNSYIVDNDTFNINSDNYYEYRTHKDLIEALESTENKNGECANIKIVEVKDGVEFMIDEYDGFERIITKYDVLG